MYDMNPSEDTLQPIYFSLLHCTRVIKVQMNPFDDKTLNLTLYGCHKAPMALSYVKPFCSQKRTTHYNKVPNVALVTERVNMLKIGKICLQPHTLAIDMS